jgi:hypothetical protein
MDLGDYNIQTSKFVFLGVFYCELLTPKFKNIRWFFFFWILTQTSTLWTL